LNNKIVIEAFNISKIYKLRGKKRYIKALDDVSFNVREGEIFGILGPNGAGKTTLISILSTLIQPTMGYARFYGHNILKKPWIVKENIGLMLNNEFLYYRLTGYQNLKFFGKLYNKKNYKEKIDYYAKKLKLKSWLNQYVYQYSTGMKIKLALIRVLILEPKVLFLDEPMLGLDPLSVREIIKLLKNLDKTILIMSHQMHIISKLCNRIAFLKKGKILKIDSKENFQKFFSDLIKIKVKFRKIDNNIINSLKEYDFITNLNKDKNKVTFDIPNQNYYPELFNILKNLPVMYISEEKLDLEDIFIRLVKD